MGILKTLTDEYFGKGIRKEEEIDISGLNVEIVSFTDKNGKHHNHGYRIKNNDESPNKQATELRCLIKRFMDKRGNDCSLNDIDVSNLKSMYDGFDGVFEGTKFNGDVSGWDVSGISNMRLMFFDCEYTGENGIFKVEKNNHITDMKEMFFCSKFNANIEDWKVNKYCAIDEMFYLTPLEENEKLPKWYIKRQKKS